MKTALALFGMLLISMGMSSPTASRAQDDRFAYAFAYQSGNRIHVNILTDTEPAGYITGFTFPVPAQYFLADASASLDGRQVAFGFYVGSWTTKIIYVLDVQTGTLYETGPFTSWIDDIQEMVEPLAPYLWSPDSTRLAYIGSPEGEYGPTDIYLYSLPDGAVINLTHDDRYHYRFAWSPDGRYLTSLNGSVNCNDNTCDVALEIWDTVDRVQMAMIDLRPFLALAIPPRTAACYFNWSPDNKYLSFMMGCDALGRFFFDMYVLNVADKTITQLTRFARPAVLWDTQVQFGTSFASIWYDPQTLLIGAAARPVFPDPGTDAIRISQTAAYTAPDWTETVLSSTVATGWALNPVSGQLAYRAAAFFDSYTFENFNVQIVTLAEKELIPQTSAPVGCHLTWSPDGTRLAYENYQYPGSTCLGLQGFTLVDGTTGEVVTIPRPADWTAVPIGWIIQSIDSAD